MQNKPGHENLSTGAVLRGDHVALIRVATLIEEPVLLGLGFEVLGASVIRVQGFRRSWD